MTKVLGFILVMNALLCCGHAEGTNLTIDPNWSTFHPGERVTFICDMNEGKDTDWEYEIKKNGEQFLRSNPYKSFTLLPIQIDHSDEYQCCGLRKSSGDTKCSDTVSLTVTAQPRATLTAGPTTIPVGGSVTLSCYLPPTGGWKYKWFRKTKNTPEVQLTDEENRDINVAQGGIYRCLGMRGNDNYQSLVSDEVSITISFSNEVVVTRQPNWPHIFSGESITLTCEVRGGETTEWTCEWRRDGKPVKVGNNKHLTVSVNESSSEEYMCQCRRRDDWFSVTKWSEKIPVSVSDAVLTIDPNWSTFHPGDRVTFICDMNEGKDTDWEYEIKKNGEQFLRSNPYKSFTLLPIQIDHSDEYQCCGLRKSSGDTKCSDTVSLTVTAQPKATLTAGPTTIPVGGSVTLSCYLPPTGGWKYKWFRKTKNTPEVQLTDEENRDINVAQAGIYRCLGMRGNENYHSLVSDEVSITISFSNKVVVTRQPNRPQMFSGESITLTCEVRGGETTEWTCEWRRDGKPVKVGNNKHLTVSVNESSSEEYMCQCRLRDDWYSVTKWSEKIPVSVSGAILTIDPNWSTFHSGERVTFICDMNEGNDTDWEYEIKKKGEQFLHYNPHKSFTLLPIQIDHSGEYQCCGHRKISGDTKCSDTVSLTVTAQPKPTLTAGPTIIPVGGNVTLSCSLPSAGWKYKWYRKTKNTPEVQLTDEENRDINVAQAGIYRCLGMRGNENYQSLVSDEVSITISFSNKVFVTRQPNRPQMFSGESITLTCEVRGGETTEWTYEWRRDGTTVKVGNDKHLTVSVNESSSEEYMCQCRLRDDWHSETKWSEKIPVSVSDPVLTVEPNWSTFYVGEFVTFICNMNEGKHTDWYQLIRNDQGFVRYQSDKHFRVEALSTGYSGEFQCCGHWSGSSYEKCSETVTVTFSDKPGAKLTAGSTTIPVGGSVILSCSVEPSAGWKYRWFRRTSDTFVVEFSRNNEENREITVTQGGIYKCDGERGNSSFYSHSSLENIIEIMFSNKVFVTRQPNWPQMFSGESITLTCEVQGGETTEWTCEWRRSGSIIHKTHSKDWTFIVSESSSGNYMCQCRIRDDWYSSTQRSETIRLSVSTKPGAKLSAGPTTIPVGGSVTLSCSVEPSAGWKYRWFRRTSDTSFVEFSRNNKENREITVTQGGIYKCDGKRGNPSFYSHSSLENNIEIMFSNKIFVTRQPNGSHVSSVTVSSPVISSFPVMLIVGPVSGIVLIVLLLLLWRCRRSKDLSCIRSFQSESSSQRPTTNHGVNQTESDYSFLLHGTTSVYETIHNRGATGKERPPDPEEGSVYVNVRPDNYSSA
ncbi:uncharacterized protein LOC116732479 isoform X2 [Xiphophorus hellerii]|uniref:uncharacterized protein LOC116732479 isoform X2 n=1 Tax=Xiphophorus hellerii TaxID=8084 RepID=UPI0013B3A12C|nr:uncharacterized protein LOC116732479 isoform X2 [Xiphophorus hellerii]